MKGFCQLRREHCGKDAMKEEEEILDGKEDKYIPAVSEGLSKDVIHCLIPIRIQDGRPSHRLSTPGGSEEQTQAYWEYVEESDAATTKVHA